MDQSDDKPLGHPGPREPRASERDVAEKSAGGGTPEAELNTRAQRCLRLFREDPAGLPAFRSVEEHLKEAGAWGTLVGVYDLRVEAIASPAEKAILLTRRGQLLEKYLSDPEGAIASYRNALESHPGDAGARERLEAVLEAGERWQELDALLEASARHVRAPAERSSLYLRLADLKATRLKRPDEAVAFYQEALAQEPGRREIFEGLCALLERLGRHEALAEALETQAAREDDGAALLERAAAIHAGPLAGTPGALDRAIACHERIVSGPDDTSRAEASLEALLDLYREDERWEGLVEALEARAALVSDPTAPLLEAADILESRLLDPARALEIRMGLLGAGSADPESLAACERLARAADDKETLALFLGHRYDAGFFEGEDEAIAINEERSRILEGIDGQEEEVARSLEAILAFDPKRRDALGRLCDLYDRLDRPVDRALKMAVVADALPEDTPDPARGEAWRDAAQALEEVGEIEHATEAYKRARTFLPNDPFILSRLQANYDSRGKRAEACSVAEAELEILCGRAPESPGLDPEREKALLERLGAGVLEAGRTADAIVYWKALLERDPAHRGALNALASIFDKTGDDEGLLSVLVKEEQIEELPERKVALLMRIGKLYETACDDPREAVSRYEQALESDHGCIPALDALLRLSPGLGRWKEQVALLAKRASFAEPARRAQYDLERARILRERLSDDEGALGALEEAVSASPDHRVAIQELGDLYRATERWNDLDALLARCEERESRAKRRAEIAEARAELWEGPLNNPEKAARLWQSVLAAVPDHPVARERLTAFHRAANRWADLAVVLEEELGQGPSPERALALHGALANICEEQLGRPEEALDHFRAAVALNPADKAMREGLHRGLARAEAWDELVAVLREEAEAHRETRPHRWADALVKIAGIHDDALDDSAGAEGILEEVLACVPEHEGAQSRLFRILEARGDLGGLARLLDSCLAGCEQTERRAALAHEAMRVAVAREAAGDTGAEETIAACKRVIEIDEQDDDALRILASRLEESRRFKELLDVLGRRLATPLGREARLDLTLRLAALWEDHFHRPDRALQHFRQARQIDSTCLPALRAMARLCEQEGRWEEFIGVCESLSKEEPDTMARSAAMYRMAFVLAERFGRDHDAIGNLERSLDLDPENQDARDYLEILARKHCRYRTLARILRDRIESSDHDGAARVGAEAEDAAPGSGATLIAARWEELGDVLADYLSEPREAAQAYRESCARADDPSHLKRAGLKLERIYRNLRDTDALLALYPELLGAMANSVLPADQGEAAGVWARYGDLLAENASSTALLAKAADAYQRAGELDPDGTIRFDARRDLLERIGTKQDLAVHLEEGASRLGATADGAALWVAAGNAWNESGRADEAERAYGRALESDNRSAQAYEALGRLLERQERKSDLAALYEDQTTIVSSAEEERTLRLLAADLLRQIPGRSAQALAHYRRVLALGSPTGDILRAIADLSLLTGDESGAVEALERYLEAPPPREDLVWTLSMLTRLWEAPLGRKGRAIAYCRMWLEADPNSENARGCLERLLEERNEWRDLASLLEERCSGRGPGVTERLRRVAGIYAERLADPESALEAWRRVLNLEPDAADALTAVADNAPDLGRWREAASALERLITLSPDARDRRALRLRLANLLAGHPTEIPTAIDHINAALDEEAPEEEAAPARLLLRELLEQEGRFEEVADLLRDSLRDAPETSHASLYAALGEVCERRLGWFHEAADAYEKWLALEPKDKDCIQRLEGLYRRLERWGDLKKLLARERAMKVGKGRRLAIAHELAALEEERLASPAMAAAELEKGLSIAPGDAAAIGELARIYRGLGDHEALHRTLQRAIALPAAAETAGALYLESARLESEALGRPEEAVASYEKALSVAEDPVSVLEELANLQDRLGRSADYLATLTRLCEEVRGDEAKSAVLERMGEAYERAGDIPQAVACLNKAVEIAPESPNVLASLRRLHEQMSNWEGAVKALALHVACVGDQREAGALAADLGHLLENALGDETGAEAWYARAVELDDTCRQAHARLGSRMFAASDFEGARRHLRQALEQTPDSGAREENAMLAFRLGVSAGRLNCPDEAILALRKAIRWQPSLTEGWEALGRIYLDTREWESAVEVLTIVANTEGLEERRRTEALYGMAIAQRALGCLEEGLASAERAIEEGTDRFDVYALRAEILVALDRKREASEAWRRAADSSPDNERRGECLYRGAIILETLPEEKDRAVGWLEESHAAHPGHTGALRRLADHAIERRDWGEAKSCLEALCDLRNDARDHTDLGRVWWHGFGEEQRALSSLRAALELPHAGLDAVELAVGICADQENWPRVTAVIEGYLEGKELTVEHVPLLQQLAAVYAEKLYDTAAACRVLRAMVKLAPDDLDARDALAIILARDTGTHDEALEQHRRLIAASPLRASAWRGLAGLYWFAKRFSGCRLAAEMVRITGGKADESWEQSPFQPLASAQGATAASLFARGTPARAALEEPTLLNPIRAALEGAWMRLCPGPPETAGGSSDWLGDRAAVLDSALGFWGIAGTPVVPASDGPEPIAVLGGDQVAIAVQEASLRDCPKAVWRFLCHRTAARIALGHGPAAILNARSLAALLAALRQAAGIEDAAPTPGAGAFADRVAGLLGWRNRSKVRKALERMGPTKVGDLASCVSGLAESADRAALLACGNMTAALGAMVLLERGASGPHSLSEPLMPQIQNSRAATRLLVFASGSRFLEALEDVSGRK